MQVFAVFSQVVILFCSQLGTCVAHDANPAAEITWLKNNERLVADEKGMFSSSSMTVSANKTASRVALTFINITITNVLILSGWDHYCELLFQ